MRHITLLVVADPRAGYLSALEQLSSTVRVVISDQAEILAEAAPQADVILYGNIPKLLRAIFPAARRLRWIHSLNTGVERILFPELAMSPVILTNSKGIYKTALAEFVMTGVLFFTKDVGRLIHNQQLGLWHQFDADEARGTTMGIVGYGETGRACAELARSFGMRVFGLRRRAELSQNGQLLERTFARDCLVEMLSFCDFVVLSAPATTETYHLIADAELKSMKPSAVLINVGRGSLVDEQALIKALQQGWIRGAALDVFEVEPLPTGHPFYGMSNVLLSPHSTDHTQGWRERAMQDFIRNFYKFLEGQPMENVVDKLAGY